MCTVAYSKAAVMTEVLQERGKFLSTRVIVLVQDFPSMQVIAEKAVLTDAQQFPFTLAN